MPGRADEAEGTTGRSGGWRGSWLRKAMWGGAAVLLALPAVAMRFTAEVYWTGSDFFFAAVLLFGAAGLVELAMRSSAGLAYHAGALVAVATAFLTIWSNAAVGMIGSEDNPYNNLFLAVIALAAVGAVAARFRAGGMALAMAVAATAQVIVGGVGMASDQHGGIISVAFGALWLLSAVLFHKAGGDSLRQSA